MEFSKNRNVPAPFWLFILELANMTKGNTTILKNLKIVTELWEDRLIKGSYKVIVKDIKNDLKNNDDTNVYYELGTILSQLIHDDIVKDGITKINQILEEHFIKE